MNTSTAMNCIYSLPCFSSDSNDILNNFHVPMYLVPISTYKFHLNSHEEPVNICIRIPSEILQFLPSFKLGNSIPSTKTDTNLLHKYEIFFLKTGNLITN